MEERFGNFRNGPPFYNRQYNAKGFGLVEANVFWVFEMREHVRNVGILFSKLIFFYVSKFA